VISSVDRLSKLKNKWLQLALKETTTEKLIFQHQESYPTPPSREDHLPTENKVIWDNELAKDYTVCQLFSRSRPGLLYRLAKVFADHCVTVMGAKISTCIENAEDVFYLQKDGTSFKVDEESELNLELLKTLAAD
jgi:[protein-PII] uridylyltransferase